MGKIHSSEDNDWACNEFPESVKLERSEDISPFMVAMRGDCSFV